MAGMGAVGPVVLADGTPPPAQATPAVAANGGGRVCVLAYLDGDGNGRREVSEVPLGDVEFDLSRAGQPVAKYQTEGKPQTYCFDHLAIGQYHMQAKLPPGIVASTPVEMVVNTQAEASPVVEVGGRPESAVAAGAVSPAPAGDSWLPLGIASLIAVAVIGLGARLLMQARPA